MVPVPPALDGPRRPGRGGAGAEPAAGFRMGRDRAARGTGGTVRSNPRTEAGSGSRVGMPVPARRSGRDSWGDGLPVSGVGIGA